MQILDLEEKYSQLKSDLSGQVSKRTKLLKISGYLGFALSNSNSHIIEPYLIDLIPDFLKYTNDLEIRGLNPKQIYILKSQLIQLKNFGFNGIESSEFEKVIQSIDDKIILMNKWLESTISIKSNAKIYFPLLEKNENQIGPGYLESVSVIIKSGEQKFHISPADLENDEQLEKQIQLCFNKALEYCSQFIKKIKKTHTVYLHFENRLGILIGNSLGAALTVSFIEALLKYYNSPTVVRINKFLTITGGIDQNSNLISTSKVIIETKVETVFYSDVEILCVPKIDEMWAEEKLKHLKEKYPNRNLKIVGLTDLTDLLDRRNVVDIHKQKVIVRTTKFAAKKWKSVLLAAVLTMILTYMFALDFDKNPYSVYADGNNIYVINKKGNLLWSYHHPLEKFIYLNPSSLKYFIKLYDIDNDGQNEIFYIQIPSNDSNQRIKQPMIIALSNLKDTLWTYTFRDLVVSERESLSSDYNLNFIGITQLEKKDILVCFAQNATSFSNAVFLLDIKTGKRINKTHWVSGHIMGGMIMDINNDNKDDLILSGIDNGYEEAVLWGLEFKDLDGYRHTIPSYIIKGKTESKLMFYIRIPKLDYENYLGFRSSGIDFASLTYLENDSLIRCLTISYRDRSMTERLPLMDYYFNSNLKDVNIFVSSSFRVVRDTLVARGLLNQPYTDTKEYINLQKSKILYWKDGKWVDRFGNKRK